MDYGALPPEINSGRMYAGPGSGPMLAAAATWDGLAAELYVTAGGYASVISDLTSVWSGPAATSMAAAVTPYLAWLNAIAGQAEHTAVQAKTAVAAYEAAFAMTVPPPMIAANRAQLMMLVATNFFGQNFPAIAATEAHYLEMWAQDAAAMYGYADASAGASAFAAFDQPPPTTNPAGQAGQAAAVTHAAETSAGTSAESTSSAGPGSVLGWLLGQPVEEGGWFSSPTAKLFADQIANDISLPYHELGNVEHYMALQSGMPTTGVAAGPVGATTVPGLGSLPGLGSAASTGVSAGAGEAGTIGRLSVPQSWTQAAPATNLTSATSPISAGSVAAGGKAEGLLRGIPLAPAAAAGRRVGGVLTHRYGFRHRVMHRPVVGG